MGGTAPDTIIAWWNVFRNGARRAQCFGDKKEAASTYLYSSVGLNNV